MVVGSGYRGWVSRVGRAGSDVKKIEANCTRKRIHRH